MEPVTSKAEEKLYYPIRQKLREIFDMYYVEKPYAYVKNKNTGEWLQRAPSDGITNPYLDISANGDFSEKLQRIFDYPLFAALYAERLKPDIMGFVKKKPNSKPEIITVEIKANALKIRDVLQAKMYSDIFDANFSFIFSPLGISIPKLKTILEHDNNLRGKVIIGQCSKNGDKIRFYPEMEKHIRKELRQLCSPKNV